MADAENETHSGDLPVLHPLPPTHFVNEKACYSLKQQEKLDLQTCLNNGFQLFADTLMTKFENLTNIIVEKGPSRAKAKVGKVDNDERAISEPSSDSESDLEEQVRQRKEKQKVQINSSRAKADEWK